MFEDLKGQDILNALDSVIKKGDGRESKYGLWYHGKAYSPAKVISEAFELKKAPINRQEFNTDVVQKKLMELGFPIVERGNSFFSVKELESFTQLAGRSIYNSADPIDQNIGYFLNQVIWEKSRQWALGLQELGWDFEGSKNWNEQDINGQRFKKYTWYRIYPKDFHHPLLFFTIGVQSDDGSLVYKLDIKGQDAFFEGRREYFYKERDDRGAGWQVINTIDLKDENFDSLITKSHDFFKDKLKDYKFFLDHFWGEKRIMRLTWNTNNWELPIHHKWSSEDQKNPNVTYEKQYGFGHEEWLLNPRYRKGDFQYGYIRGVDHMSKEINTINKVILFTINPNDKKRYLVGQLLNVEIIESYEEEIEMFRPIYDEYFNDMVEELKAVDADYNYFKKSALFPNVKFKLENATIYNGLVLTEVLNSDKYTRFQPYILDENIELAIERSLTPETKLNFQSGIANSSDSYSKTTKSGTSKVSRYHSRITRDLNDYLRQVEGYENEQISIEKTKVGVATIDAVVRKEDALLLYEIKTSSIALSNIRQALGQIFEYALLDGGAVVDHLYIVGPASLKPQERNYWARLKNVIDIPMTYIEYNAQSETLDKKFIKY
ncbi:MAG: hypothetical protein AAGA64_13150 [Bacteroidota bacterium]